MLTDKQRQKIIDKLASEPSDTRLAERFGVSRATIRRIRLDEQTQQTEPKKKTKKSKAKDKMQKAKPVVEQQPVQAAPLPVIPVPVIPVPVIPVPVIPVPVIPMPAPVVPQRTLRVDLPKVALTPKFDPAPKVDVEPGMMGTYFAVQLLRGEHVKDVANAVMQAAEERGFLFRKLQVLDCISVGTSSFVRFRSDLSDPPAVLGSLSRGFISFSDGSYKITFADGRRSVRYPTTVMCSVQKAGYGIVYAGPRVARWRAQFQART